MEVAAEKTLFIGPFLGNTGPENVNRAIIENWSQEIIVPQGESKIQKLISLLYGLKTCDVVLSATYDWLGYLLALVCGKLRKPYIAIVHGYLPYEDKINNLGIKQETCIQYDKWLRNSTKIIVFSGIQKKMISEFLPEVENKIVACPMAIKKRELCSVERNNTIPIIAVSGGTRPIKQNEKAFNAVRELCKKGTICEFRIYGRNYCGDIAAFAKNCYGGTVKFMGQVSNENFMKDLQEIDLFIMASIHEPFGISAIDALQSGASLLIGEHCGAIETIKAEDSDIIFDKDSLICIARKIDTLLQESNATRLMSSFDNEKYSAVNSAKTIRGICNRVVMEVKNGK